MASPSVAMGGPSESAPEDRLARELVRDLHVVRPSRYWADLLATSLIGWPAFALTVYLRPWSPQMLLSAVTAVLALYRGLSFIHEISHQHGRTVLGFETVWNLLIGYPLLLPSVVYADVHQFHHRLSTYGTVYDPEYLPFARSPLMTVVFAFQSLLIPLVLALRFMVLSPVGLVSPSLQRWLVVHLSSVTMNIAFRREATPELERLVRRQSVHIILMFAVILCLCALKILPWTLFAVWFGVSALFSFINTLRTLGAHAYESEGNSMDRAGQLADSIDTPGAPWTELWAPVGLRYHALHHYFPGIPYHNLGEAWRRLSNALPAHAQYHQVQSPGLLHSLLALYRKGRRAQHMPNI